MNPAPPVTRTFIHPSVRRPIVSKRPRARAYPMAVGPVPGTEHTGSSTMTALDRTYGPSRRGRPGRNLHDQGVRSRMCGIAGLLGPPGDPAEARAMGIRMATTLAHRGPDDSGDWADDRGPAALGLRRLPIIHLSPEGHQPMRSADGRYVMIYNGEIYDFLDLRAELEAAGCTFRGHSDSEVLLAAVSRWGVEAAIPRLWGMFAIALWDEQERVLH